MGSGAKEGTVENEAGGMAPCEARGFWPVVERATPMKLIILFVIVVGAILFLWLRSIKPKRRI